MPVGELKDLRRRALAELDDRRLADRRRSRRAGRGPRRRPPRSERRARRQPMAAPAVVVLLRPGERALAAPGVERALPRPARLRPSACGGDRGRRGRARAAGLPLRVRLPEILFDADEPWLRAILARRGTPSTRVTSASSTLGSGPSGSASDVPVHPRVPAAGLEQLGRARPPPASPAARRRRRWTARGLSRRLAAVCPSNRRQPSRSSPSAASSCCIPAISWAGRRASSSPRPRQARRLDAQRRQGLCVPRRASTPAARVSSTPVSPTSPESRRARGSRSRAFFVVQSRRRTRASPGAAALRLRQQGGLTARCASPGASRERSTTGHPLRGARRPPSDERLGGSCRLQPESGTVWIPRPHRPLRDPEVSAS